MTAPQSPAGPFSGAPRLTQSVVPRRITDRIRVTDDGHWLWTGCRWGLHREYGQTTLQGKHTSVHRAVWILLRGPIPDGLDVLHQCGQSLCCNPDHVHLGTHKENLAEARAARGGVHWSRKGENHPRARLAWADIQAIRAADEDYAALAARFGVTKGYIGAIVRGARWQAAR